jgi:hypothetical protein
VPRLATSFSVLAVLLFAGCGGGGTLSESELKKEIEAIGSTAAEGALLAHDAAEGRTTHAFTTVHSEFLDEATRKTGAKLSESSVSSGLEQRKTRAERLARRIADALSRLHDDPGNEQVARRAFAELERAAAVAEELAE